MKGMFLLFVSTFLLSFQGSDLVKTKVNDDITISLPTMFFPMSQEDMNRKYVSSKPPIALYTDESRLADLGINIAYSRWRNEDFEMMKSFYKSNIMGFYDEVQFLTEKTEEIRDKQFAVFEFIGTVKRDEDDNMTTGEVVRQYVYIQYTIVKSKTVLFNFSCPARLQNKWSPVVKEIMHSVKISKTL